MTSDQYTAVPPHTSMLDPEFGVPSMGCYVLPMSVQIYSHLAKTCYTKFSLGVNEYVDMFLNSLITLIQMFNTSLYNRKLDVITNHIIQPYNKKNEKKKPCKICISLHELVYSYQLYVTVCNYIACFLQIHFVSVLHCSHIIVLLLQSSHQFIHLQCCWKSKSTSKKDISDQQF